MAYNKSYKSYKVKEIAATSVKGHLKSSIFGMIVYGFWSAIENLFLGFVKLLKLLFVEEKLTQRINVCEEDVKRYVLQYFKGKDVEISVSRGHYDRWNVVVYDQCDFRYRTFNINDSHVWCYLESLNEK